MTPTREADCQQALELTQAALDPALTFEARFGIRAKIAAAIEQGREQGRRAMQAECLRIAEVWLDNKIGAEIAADIRALK